MRSAEVAGGVLVAVLRVIAVATFYASLDPWAREESLPVLLLTDWVAVLALFWAAVALTGDRPKVRAGLMAVTSIWIGIIYAIHQGPHAFWLFTGA